MAMTLTEMKVGMSDKVSQQVVDTFVRKSEVLEMLPFDNTVSPGGGSTLIYGYVQKKLPSTTAFRAINNEYSASVATVEKKTAELKVFGGAFEIDRVIKDAEGRYNNMALQLEEKITSAIGTFHNAMIHGDSAVNANEFDGLDKFLVGQTTEFNTGVGGAIDLSTMENLTANADVFYEALLKLINNTGASAIMVNEDMKTKIQTVARKLGYKTESEEAFGRTITTIGEGKVRLIDLGNVATVTGAGTTGDPYVAVESPIIGKVSRQILATKKYFEATSTATGALLVVADTATPGASEVKVSVVNAAKDVTMTADAEAGDYVTYKYGTVTGLTDIFAVKFDVNEGFHGISLIGSNAISTFLPNFQTPGAVKEGEVEAVMAVALKNVKRAGVLRNIKIA